MAFSIIVLPFDQCCFVHPSLNSNLRELYFQAEQPALLMLTQLQQRCDSAKCCQFPHNNATPQIYVRTRLTIRPQINFRILRRENLQNVVPVSSKLLGETVYGLDRSRLKSNFTRSHSFGGKQQQCQSSQYCNTGPQFLHPGLYFLQKSFPVLRPQWRQCVPLPH